MYKTQKFVSSAVSTNIYSAITEKFLTRKCSEELSQRRHVVRMVEWNTVQWTLDIHAVSPDKHGSRRQRQAPELASARPETTQECNVTTTAVNTDNKQHNP